MPIKSSEEAIGKYVGKHIESRQEADKGVRLVRYSRGARVASIPWRVALPAADPVAPVNTAFAVRLPTKPKKGPQHAVGLGIKQSAPCY